MRKLGAFAYLVVVAAAAGVLPAKAANSPPAMIVPGQFNVAATGAASYTIPITTPPGSAGMLPVLSLSYSSQSGDGLTGIGWTLNGLPSISRCPRTIAQDGTHGSVNYDSNDKFCMEGQRLIGISGTYGADGSEYRTEVEGYSRIIAHGSAGSGPAWFEVHTKSGQIMQFGNTADSQVLATGKSTARSWAVNKISDTVGNYLTVTYNSATGTDRTTYGQAYPLEIDYTGNASAGVSPYNSVRFTYSSRTDSTPIYQAGSVTQTTVLMSNIKTYQGANVVSDYRLTYRVGTTTVHSRMTSVTLCDGAGACLNPTTFTWQGGTGYLTMSGASQTVSQDNTITPGDFNGDGISDVLLLPKGQVTCPTSFTIYNGPGFTTASSTPFPNPVNDALYCRINGATQSVIAPNGVSNVLISIVGVYGEVAPHTYKTFIYTLNTGIGNYGSGYYYGSASSVPTSYSGDFGGDGLADIFLQGNPSSIVPKTSAGGWGTSYTVGNYGGLSVGIADFDGDGCSDIFAAGGTNSVTYSCSPATSSSTPPTASGYSPVLGDFNGDGKTDVLLVSASGAAQLWLATGTGFTQVNSTLPNDWGKYSVYVGDFNGDGKADLALIAACNTGGYCSGTSHKFFISTGTGFAQAVDSGNNPITISSSASCSGSPGCVTASPSDWNNDGATDLWLQQPTTYGGDSLYTFSYVPELMTSVSNGIGANTNITYAPINQNGSLYQKCSTLGTYNCGDVYPTQSIDGALYVVSRVDASNGLGSCPGNCYSSTYGYAMAKTDLTGRGFLGFGQVIVTDLQTNVVQTTNYSQVFPYTSEVTSQTKTHSSTTLSSVTNTLANNSGCGITPAGSGVYATCTTQSATAASDLNGAAFPTVTTSNTYDNYGNALTVNVSMSDGSYKNTTNTYNNDATNWFLGRLLSTSVTSHVGSSTLTRSSSFSYDSTTGLLTQEVIAPGVSTCNSGSSSCTVTTTYTYDAFGHRITTTVTGTGITTRSSAAVYDSFGQFQIKAINALNQSESWVYDARFGTPTSHTGPNLLTTSWAYDNFGRITQENRPDGTITKTSYAYCSGGCPNLGAFSAQAEAFASNGTTQIGPIGTQYYDSLSRSIASDVQGFDGSNIRAATQYDGNGRVLQTSRPYYTSSGTPHWTSFTYDDLGRVTQATFPDTSHTAYGFNALVTTVTNNLSQTTTTTKNAQGLTASVQDAASHTTSYVYDAFGNLLTVTDPASNVITNAYDIRGNKVSSTDPDLGSWTYAYDVLGELTSQTDAKSQTTSLTYDLLGRPLTRTESSLYSAWTYGTSPGAHSIGQVIEAQACTTSSCTTVVSDRTFTFDSLGRPDSTSLKIGSNYYGYHETYNTTNGKLANITYPSGFLVNYNYNGLGYLTGLTDAVGSSIWAANARDAEMHLTSATQGNGILTTQSFDPNTGLIQNQVAGPSGAIASFAYTFDTIGNLTARTDNVQAYTERFCFDSLNRLVNFNIAAACTGGKTAAYDSTGNITSRSEVGTYSYPTAGSARPHAVSSITGSVDGLTNPKYTYDANGNMTCTSTGTNCTGTIGRQFTVTSFNMAATLVQGTTNIALTYDDQHARIIQAATVSGTTTTTTYLNDPASGAMSQKVQVGTAIPQWVDYIQADGQIVAQRTVTYPAGALWGFNNWASFNWGAPTGSVWGSFNWGSGTWTGPVVTWAYFTNDHLGSVAVITDQGGNVVQRLFYDPWGKRRNANGTDATCGTITSSVTRGFTNQEQMPVGCFVNLNARIYDAKIGRFLSADPIIGDASVPQELNRYAYVLNNPLSLTDPSGLCFLGCFWNSREFRTIFAVALVVAFQRWELLPKIGAILGFSTTSATFAAATNGAILGGLAGGVATGTLKGAAFGALGGGLAAGLGGPLGTTLGQHVGTTAGNFIAQGLVGGAVSAASGGNFGSGFLAAGFGTLGGSLGLSGGPFSTGNLVASAVLGGAGSVLGGGKFANGAVTGAFSYAAGASYANDDEPTNRAPLNQYAANDNGVKSDAIEAWPTDKGFFEIWGTALAGAFAPELRGLKALYDWLTPNTQNTYNFTNTVEGNAASRPYINSPLTIQEIEATGKGVPDPGGLPNALRYDVPGTYNGSRGTYQLVIDPKTNTVYHFLFTGK